MQTDQLQVVVRILYELEHSEPLAPNDELENEEIDSLLRIPAPSSPTSRKLRNATSKGLKFSEKQV